MARLALRENSVVAIIVSDSPATASDRVFAAVTPSFRRGPKRAHNRSRGRKRGQVAQVVERSPEKAGVGGSTPSLATIILSNLTISSLLQLRTIAHKILLPEF